MPVYRIDIERALDELISQEQGLRFQEVAVQLGKMRWPELIAHQRKKDFGLDAYAPATETPEKVGKGLAASITPALRKVSGDAERATKHFPDLRMLLFVTAAKVGNADRQTWGEVIQKEHGLELQIIEREEIITLARMPQHAWLCTRLGLDTDSEPQVADLVNKARRAAAAVTRAWAAKIRGPLLDLRAERLDSKDAPPSDPLSLDDIDELLSRGYRIVLEGPAGRGKTTTLIQLAGRPRSAGTPFLVNLSAWTSSGQGILEYIAGMPAFLAERLMAHDLARVQQAEPFMLLLNGWNEIAESNSVRASDALRELERDFPTAGIIVATRTHYLTPPLPGTLRLRLLSLSRAQRATYLENRLGAKGAELRARIDGDLSLDELVRTPFTLSAVASLFEAGAAEVPSTRAGLLTQVVHLQAQRHEHRNALQAAPTFGLHADYLRALATEMTARGAVALPEADARSIVAGVARRLTNDGQIVQVAAPTVLATLTAHHVLERVDYPQTMFQFEHQQLQEHFAALDVHAQLLDLQDDDQNSAGRFTAEYVNDPAWAEPLRMVAEMLAETGDGGGADMRDTGVGERLVKMALAVDLVFAGELARLCGSAVWNEVRADVGERFRAVHAISEHGYRQSALAAMLATGSDDFSDIIVPLFSEKDQYARRRAYELWRDIRVSSLGPNWRQQVRGWSDDLRADFVSELLHQRIDDTVADFAAEDPSSAVKKAAVSALTWNWSEDALARVLKSMDVRTFEDVARENPDLMPTSLRPQTVAATYRFIETSSDHFARLQAALDLAKYFGEDLDGVIKDAMVALPGTDIHQPAFEHLRHSDPTWTSEWLANQIAEGNLYGHEHWLPFAATIPGDLVEKHLCRLETQYLRNTNFAGAIAVIAASADVGIAARTFARLRELRRKVDGQPGQRHEFERQVVDQLEALYLRLPDDIAAAGIISSVRPGDLLDIRVATRLLSRVARLDAEPLRVDDMGLQARLRAYLKGSVELVLHQDDFHGEEKAHLASSIAQVGEPEDMADLMNLIRADIDRVRCGRAALAAGDRGPLAMGGRMSYARWHIAAVTHLHPAGAEQALIDLLCVPEYVMDAAVAMARDFVPEPPSFDTTRRYDLMWAAREGRTPPASSDQRSTRFAAALNAQIERLQNEDGESLQLLEMAKALAAIDGRGSAAVVLESIATPSQWNQHDRLDAADRLLMAGAVLPTNTACALVDSTLERADTQDSYLLRRSLALCPFVDDPPAGIAKVRKVVQQQRIRRGDLCELVAALGESRSDAAADVLIELASDPLTFEQCEKRLISAVAALDTQLEGELLVDLVDPDIRGMELPRCLHSTELVFRLAELAEHRPEVGARLRRLCERDLPELNRHILSSVMGWLATPEALATGLHLIDDMKPAPVPRGIDDLLRSAFLEQGPYALNSNVHAKHARASSELRLRLFRMVRDDPRRGKSAFGLLGVIEEWRLEGLEDGRPTRIPRHPDLASGQSWPPAAEP